MDAILARLAEMRSEEGERYGLTFRPRPDDVFIATYPKCGTTWVCFIAHCLRTRGHTDFDEIAEVVPWTIYALDCKQNLDDDQIAYPRLFKVTILFETLLRITFYSRTRTLTGSVRAGSTYTWLVIQLRFVSPSSSSWWR